MTWETGRVDYLRDVDAPAQRQYEPGDWPAPPTDARGRGSFSCCLGCGLRKTPCDDYANSPEGCPKQGPRNAASTGAVKSSRRWRRFRRRRQVAQR
jgi:hypothetical protein